jgi:23S rRNA (guanine745-N1)-methyltransferase
MLDDVLSYLECPACRAALRRSDAMLRCAGGHAFDIARQGYVSLLPPGERAAAGDTAAMVAARDRFLAAGHYAGLARELGRVAAAALESAATGSPGAADAGATGPVPGCVADVGAGPGYYLTAVLDRVPGRAGLALDTSKFALRRAARAHPRIGAVAADAWRRLPVADGAAAAVLNVFAPRSGAELRRILSPHGRLLVITPEPDHLRELAGPLGLLEVDPRKDERLAGNLGPYFSLVARHQYGASLGLGHADAAAAVAMGPSAWHADPAALAARIRLLPASVPVTVAVTISVFRPERVVIGGRDRRS